MLLLQQGSILWLHVRWGGLEGRASPVQIQMEADQTGTPVVRGLDRITSEGKNCRELKGLMRVIRAITGPLTHGSGLCPRRTNEPNTGWKKEKRGSGNS